MNFRTTLILIVLLAGGLIFVFVANRNAPPDETAQQPVDPKGHKLFTVSADDIQKLTIRPSDGGKPIELAKDASKWKLVQPVAWPADDFEARGLVNLIVDLHERGGVELSGSEAAATGLDKPRYALDATDKNGKTYHLDIGNRSALGSDLYVKTSDGKGALVTGGALADKLATGDKLVTALRDKQLVKTPSFDVKQVRIDHRGQKLVLHKQGNDWKVVEPAQVPADSGEVSTLLADVTNLRADEFIDPPGAEDSAAQLDRPKAVVWLSTAVPTTQPASGPASQPAGVTVTIGQFADVDREKAYVKVSDPGVVARVSLNQSTLDRIAGASPLSLRDRKVLEIDPEKVESIAIQLDRPAATQPTTRPADNRQLVINRRKETPIIGPALPSTAPATGPTSAASSQPTTSLAASQPATQPASKWVFKSGNTGDAEEGQVQALLTALHPLRADKYLEKPAPATQPAGSYVLTIRVAPGTEGPAEFTIRLTDPGNEGKLIGSYNDLTFETDRSLIDKLTGDFKTKKPETAPPPTFGGNPLS